MSIYVIVQGGFFFLGGVELSKEKCGSEVGYEGYTLELKKPKMNKRKGMEKKKEKRKRNY